MRSKISIASRISLCVAPVRLSSCFARDLEHEGNGNLENHALLSHIRTPI